MPRQLIRDFGTCLSFDGVNDSVSLGTFDPSTTHLSISFWHKGYLGGTRGIISKRDAWDDATGGRWQVTTNEADAQAYIHFERWGGGINTGIALDNGDWHHFVITHNYNTEIKVYKDSVLAGTLGGFEYGTKSTAGIFIGQNGQGGEYFKGLLDEVCIWNKVLVQAEVDQLFLNQVLPTAISGLQCWYKFDEGSGTSATDSSGNAHTGTIDGATYSTNVAMKPRTVS